MGIKRKQIKEDKKESMKKSIKESILEKESREPTQNEINKIYINTKKRIKDEKKESIKKSVLEKEKRELTQKEINRIYKNTKQNNTGKENKNFSDLLDYLLDKKNQVKISTKFQIVGESGINAGGPTRSIFEKCHKIFLERYFKEYIFDENYYVILKDLNEELFEEFKKACEFMIFLAKKGDVKILIQINPQVLESLELGTSKYYKKYVLLNNSNNSFSLKRIKNGINDPFNSNNKLNSVSLKRIQNELNNNSNNSFNLKRIQRQKRYDINENEINESDLFKKLFENNIILDHKHFNKVKEFYKKFWKNNPTVFTNHIDYSWDNFKERLRFKLPKSDIFISFDELMKKENIQINAYPFIELILDYLQYSDEYRMRFTTLTCGSYTYTGTILLKVINNNFFKEPFNAHTCFNNIEIYINLLDLRPKLYDLLFCQSKNNNVKNKSGNSLDNANGNENGNGPHVNENGNGPHVNENGNGPHVNGNVNGNRPHVNGNVNGNRPHVNGNVNGNRPHVNGNVNVNGNRPRNVCNYSIEKLYKFIRKTIDDGFNIA
jgi:hypothetical protein